MQSTGIVLRFDEKCEVSPTVRAVWESLADEAAGDMLRPHCAEIVVTNEFNRVAGFYAAQAVDSPNDPEVAAEYDAEKPDGAMAAARTIPLGEDKTVIVVGEHAWRLGKEKLHRVLMHEAQHVRMIQGDDVAHAVHRKVEFPRPAALKWEFVWMAEGVVDEFRCERALHERGLDALGMGSEPDDYQGIVVLFDEIRREYSRKGDLQSACMATLNVFDRLTAYLAYAAAEAAVRKDLRTRWSAIPGVDALLRQLSDIPGSRDEVDVAVRASLVLNLSILLHEMLRGLGFDFYFLPDYTSYFEFLSR